VPFRRGQSGNPGGRPKGYAEFRRAAASKGKRALEVLEHLMEFADDERVRMLAAVQICAHAGFHPAKSPDVIVDQRQVHARLAPSSASALPTSELMRRLAAKKGDGE
jgi:hypothetical protein